MHHFYTQLEMDVMTSWTVWLMGVPIGFKLNSGLANFLGALVLTVLKLWNVLTSVLAPIEPLILALIASTGTMGLTALLACILDLLRLLVAHVWLIYSVLAKAHSVQIYVLRSLWYLFRGKK